MKKKRNKRSFEDPLIDEVRERRRKLLEEHDNDLDKLFETIRKMEAKHARKVVDRTTTRKR